MVETALVVLVPEAEAAVGDLRRAHTWDAPRGVPAHVTLLYPFADSASVPVDAVADVVARWEPFDVALRRTARFPRVLYLLPEPVERFVAITRELVDRFPEYPRYGGAYDTIDPHCTVAEGDDALLDRLDAEVAPLLPLASRAAEVTLLEEQPDGRWRERQRFPFRQSGSGTALT